VSFTRFVCVSVLLGTALAPSTAPQALDDPEFKLPSGKSQREEILRIEHEKSVQDAKRLARLGGELESDLQKTDYRILSVDILKKTDEIEKLARAIRARMKRL
jgi:hypothetical protein